MTLRPVSPVFVNGLFQPDRDALVELLGSLKPTDWDRPTVCFGWSVKDVAIHLVGGDLSNIAAVGTAPGWSRSKGRQRASSSIG